MIPHWNTIKRKAEKYGLDPFLVAAVCKQESSFVPTATRFEKGFLKWLKGRKETVKSKGFWPEDEEREWDNRATSWGLMQVLGEVLREFGFIGEFEELFEPDMGIEWGCKILSAYKKQCNGKVLASLLRYNGGGRPAYADEVLAKLIVLKNEEAS